MNKKMKMFMSAMLIFTIVPVSKMVHADYDEEIIEQRRVIARELYKEFT